MKPNIHFAHIQINLNEGGIIQGCYLTVMSNGIDEKFNLED